MSLLKDVEKNADKVRFHTPGHSGKLDLSGTYDVTELSYSDNLLHPQGSIARLEEKIASVYSAEACFISTQGATTSLRQAILATADRGDFLLIGKIHSSVYNTMRLFSLRAYHVDELTEDTVLPPSVRTAVLTAPDYEGHCLDLPFCCRFLHERGVLVLCDGAHGSHLVFSDKRLAATFSNVDLLVHSLHKTLPVATGGSVLLTRGAGLAERCALVRKILHGTSPSYITLCSIEKAFENADAYPERYRDVLRSVDRFSSALLPPFTVSANADKTRLVVTSPFPGEAVASALEKAGFVAETSAGNKVVFIVTPENHDRLPALQKAFAALDTASFAAYRADPPYRKTHAVPTLLTFGGQWEEVPLEQAVGRKLYLEVGLYPPGVPLLYSHEVLTPEAASLLASHPHGRFGLNGDNVYVLKR